MIHHSERMMHMPSKSALLCLVAKRDHVSQTVCRHLKVHEPWPANRGGALCIGSTATPLAILHTRHPISLLTGVTPGLISTPTPVHALHNTGIIEDLRMCQWWTRSPQAVGFPLTPDSRHNQRSSPSAKGSTCGYYKAGYNSSLRVKVPCLYYDRATAMRQWRPEQLHPPPPFREHWVTIGQHGKGRTGSSKCQLPTPGVMVRSDALRATSSTGANVVQGGRHPVATTPASTSSCHHRLCHSHDDRPSGCQ